MLVSMTGYCSLSEQLVLPDAGKIGVVVELKTLNGRFFEVVAKLPSSMSHLELPINALLQQKLIRGRVYLNIRIDDVQQVLSVIEPSWHAIDQYVAATQAIKQKYNFGGEVTIADIMTMPNVLVAREGALSANDEKMFITQVQKAADAVIKTRREEGVRLEKDFEKIFTTCAQKIDVIVKNFEQIVQQHKEQAGQALAAATTEQQVTLAEELQVTLRKLDIHEEITRFKSHLASVAPVFAAPAIEKGKRLDFILQELMRETNTMMAKCSAFSVSSQCIDIKVELEKAREQVQNIV